MPNAAFTTVLLALAASAASAVTLAVPGAPQSPYADTESVTNAAVRVTVNGVAAMVEAVTIRLDNDPWLFIAR